MKTFRINATTTIDIYVEVIAETMEDAVCMVEDNVSLTEYCNNTIGAEWNGAWSDIEGDIEVCENGYIEVHEEYSECIDEGDDEEDDDEEDD